MPIFAYNLQQSSKNIYKNQITKNQAIKPEIF